MSDHEVSEHGRRKRKQQQKQEGERLYGTVAAAKLLGLHRSTLNVAVRKHLLIPDERTPGGHLRFRRTTLEAFRERLAAWPATGGGAATAPLHLLADLCDLLARDVAPETFADRIVTGLPRALPGIEMCFVARVVAEPEDRLAPHIIARSHLPDEVWALFEQLKTTFRFAVTTVLRTLSPEYCEDASATPLHTGTLELRRIWALGSYAALPAISGGRPVGALICAGPAPRTFTEHDQALLGAVADLLAVALARHTIHDGPLPHEKEG